MTPTGIVDLRVAFEEMWAQLAPIGREADGGYHRLAWTPADLECRAWFEAQAERRGLTFEEDPNGNQWAWWGCPGPGAVVTGSHLDSVPGGGAYDGPLGVVSGFLALDVLRSRLTESSGVAALGGAGGGVGAGVGGRVGAGAVGGAGEPGGAGPGPAPRRPVAIVNFADEEGARWGVACVGSRLMAGAADPAGLLARVDAAGVSLADALRAAGRDPVGCGPDPGRLGQIGVFVELHIEQGRRLVDLDVPVGVATAVWPHGRWRLDFSGRGDHAGTTRLADRRDPVIPLAHTILAARRAAEDLDAVATVGRLAVHPGAVNAIASRATAWLDARAPSAAAVRAVVERISGEAATASGDERVEVAIAEESWSAGADFASDLRSRLAGVVEARLGRVAELATGAGHDAAILAAHVPAAMLFVRNPSGTSHDPAESATTDDCLAGVEALAAVLEDLL